MIPLQLDLENFLSYREPTTLDFRGVHLACISGANGAGKSSILDAMTWALFGQSRSKSDDDLVNRTAAQNDEWAEVQFTFDLESAIYRITRRRRAGKSTVLELQIATEKDGDDRPTDWKTLTESKIRETQAKIEDVLHMNFDSFINASFFLQGKADEFTTKTPARRKEILAELLGINVWDQYKEKVTIRRKEQEDQIRLQDARVEEIDLELTEEPERKAKVEEMESHHTFVQEQLAAKELVLTDLRKVETAVQQQKQQLETLHQNKAQTEESIQNLTQSKAQREAELAKHQAVLDERKTIESNFKKWQKLETAVADWQEKANQYNQLNRQMEPLRLTIAESRTRLEQQKQQLEKESEQAKTASDTINKLEDQLKADRDELSQLDDQIATFANQAAELQTAQSKLQKLEGERNLWQQEFAQLQKEAGRMATFEQEKSRQQEQVTQFKQQVETLTTQLTTLNEKVQQRATFEGELAAMEGEQPRLKKEMDDLKSKMTQLEDADSSVCPLCGQELSESHRAKVLVDLEGQGKERAARYRHNQAMMKTHRESLDDLAKQLQEQPRLEKQQTAQRDGLARAEAKLVEAEHALTQWAENGRQRHTDLEKLLAEDDELVALRKEVAVLETAVSQKTDLDKQRQTLQERITRADSQIENLAELKIRWQERGEAELKQVTADLDNKAYAPDAQQQLAKLEKEADAIGFDEYEQQQAIQNRNALSDAPERHQALLQAQNSQESLTNFIDTLNEQITSQEAIRDSQQNQIEQAEASLESLQSAGTDLKSVEDEVNQLREEAIQANRKLGAARQALDVLGDLQKRRKTLLTEKEEMSHRLHQLKILEEACGRNGVQALLIEAAIPEITEKANDLLGRLTGDRMSVRFLTQKELRSSKGTVRETLDIQIRDEAGERPYDNFSGGEQFRVNFAIRLALSQILAQRSGAKLQTLVIDEGFGSQDPNGRQRLIEAINTIQNDFERILVITHIEELQQAFPNQIEVIKTPSGSQITIR